MKSVFIAFDSVHTETIIELLTRNNCRGFSMVDSMKGRGSVDGEPHFGSHAWPSMCSGIITVVDDSKVDSLLSALKKLDESAPKLGLRAFVWTIEQSI